MTEMSKTKLVLMGICIAAGEISNFIITNLSFCFDKTNSH
jgi:hypothetical protein